MDSRRATTVAIFSFILLALVWGLLSIMPNVVSKESAADPAVASEGNKRAVIVYHKREGSTHTYTGAIDLPTTCHLLESIVSASYSEPTEVKVALTVQSPLTPCAETVTQQKFSTTVTSKGTPTLTVSINGVEARAVILEVK